MTDKVMVEAFRNDRQRDDRGIQGGRARCFSSGLFL